MSVPITANDEAVRVLIAEQQELERAIDRSVPCEHSPLGSNSECMNCRRHSRCDAIDRAVMRLRGQL